MNEKLEPCPICGSIKPMAKFEKLPNGMYEFQIICLNDSPCVTFKSMGVGETIDEAKDAAIEAWNTRYKRTCKNSSKHNPDMFFVCSECGWLHTKCSDKEEPQVRFCPCCGAEVLND